MMDNITVQVSGNRRAMTATAAPSNVVLQGSSDIYVVQSLHALTDSAGASITLSDKDKETLNKLFVDGVETAVLMESSGNLSVRFQNVVGRLILIVFLVSNGQGQTYIVGYQYASEQCRCIIRYKLADIGANDIMLTADNWEQYITIPSAGGEWIKTDNLYDANLYNTKELYVKLTIDGTEMCYPLHIYCPDGLGANPYYFYYLTTYYQNTPNATGVYYNGSSLECNNGSFVFKEVYYKT